MRSVCVVDGIENAGAHVELCNTGLGFPQMFMHMGEVCSQGSSDRKTHCDVVIKSSF